MVSRDPREYAFTSTPEEQELHLHGDEVVKEPMILALYPLPSCEEGRFRETDRTSMPLLGDVTVALWTQARLLYQLANSAPMRWGLSSCR